jgi:hypothetical protein
MHLKCQGTLPSRSLSLRGFSVSPLVYGALARVRKPSRDGWVTSLITHTQNLIHKKKIWAGRFSPNNIHKKTRSLKKM